MSLEVIREIKRFGIGAGKRSYIVVTTDYATASKYFCSNPYSAETGEGEQRELIQAHVKTIKKEIEDGNFTPTSISVSIKDEQRKGVLENLEDDKVKLTVPDGVTLPLIDAGHRFAALAVLREVEAYKDDIEKSDITALIMLDGNTKKDFLNLQKGRQVDKSHLHSLSVQEKLMKSKDSEALTLAYETAKILNLDDNSPFFKQIRFDSVGVSGIPISTLSSKGASDIATSLVGGAKIALKGKKDAIWLAKRIVEAYTYLKSVPELLERGMKLTPPPEGTKGSATMLIGLGNMLAYRSIMTGKDPDQSDKNRLVIVAKGHLGTKVNGNFSGPSKRDAMGLFAETFFTDIIGDKGHYGIPKELVEILSPSTFSVPKLEKAEKPAKVEKVAKPKKEKVVKPKKEKKVKKQPDAQVGDETDTSNVFEEKVSSPPVIIDTPSDVKPTETAPWEDNGVAPWEMDG